METGRGTRRWLERRRLTQREPKRHGTTFFSEQRRLVTHCQNPHQRGGIRRGQRDVSGSQGLMPSMQDTSGEIGRVRVLVRCRPHGQLAIAGSEVAAVSGRRVRLHR
jgi:hypothetical protein